MEAQRFDQAVRALSLAASRRRGVLALLGGLLTIAISGRDIESKRRGKHPHPKGKKHPQAHDEGKKRKKKKKKPTPAVVSPPGPLPSTGCPACGQCEKCDVDTGTRTMTCGGGCATACLAASICQASRTDGNFQKLAHHLGTLGFVAAGEPHAHQILEDGTETASVVTTPYRGSNGDAAEIAFVISVGGETTAYAGVVNEARNRIFVVDAGGQITEQPPVRPLPPAAGPPQAAASDPLCEEIALGKSYCDWLCTAIVADGCSLGGVFIGSAACGPAAAGCAAVGFALCELGVIDAGVCPAACDALGCTKDQCNGVQCPPGHRCVEVSGGTKQCICVLQCCDDSRCFPLQTNRVCDIGKGLCVCKPGLKECPGPEKPCRECCTTDDCFGGRLCGTCDPSSGTCTERCGVGETCQDNHCRRCTECEEAHVRLRPVCDPIRDCCLEDCAPCFECKGRPASCVPKSCPAGKVCSPGSGECECAPISCPAGQTQDPVTCQCACTECLDQSNQCLDAANNSTSPCNAACDETAAQCQAACQANYDTCEGGCGAGGSAGGASGSTIDPPCSQQCKSKQRDCNDPCTSNGGACNEDCRNQERAACQAEFDACQSSCGAGGSIAGESGGRQTARDSQHQPHAKEHTRQAKHRAKRRARTDRHDRHHG